MWFNLIKGFYDSGLWTIEMVGNGVKGKVITPTEYKKITGKKYVKKKGE